MADDNIVNLHKEKRPEWIVGPFQEYRIVIDGRMIPGLTALRQTDGRVTLGLDHRFLLDLPDEGLAYQVASFVANALAIAQGYPFLGATSKEQPFAPLARAIDPPSAS